MKGFGIMVLSGITFFIAGRCTEITNPEATGWVVSALLVLGVVLMGFGMFKLAQEIDEDRRER